MTPPLEPRIGAWRVLDTCGRGAYGIVHRVEHAEHPHLGPFALKLALHPDDLRFEREAELLSRIHHPHVPRLRDRGGWALPGGPSFPYLVMDWVEGVTLYAWASERALTSRQVLRLLAQIARALEATHAMGGVHRDVKGDNIRVRPDGHAVLVDFGSCHYRDAPTLTGHMPPPGTAPYYSPESLRFQWEHHHQPTARYLAQPADDVYALGVTAYRLVTGRYPPAVDREETQDGFRLVAPPWRPPPAWKRLSPELASLIRRMLSYEPSRRGTATDIACALERAASTSRSRVDRPLSPGSAHRPSRNGLQFPAPRSASLGWLGLTAALGTCLALGVWCAQVPPQKESPLAATLHEQDGGVVGLADTVLKSSANSTPLEPMQPQVSRDLPKKPFPGQRRPPCGTHEIEINKGCWGRSGNASPPCDDHSVEWKNSCFWPIFELPRPPTSETP
ncbi:serine/threonine protein kinase [Stigmatella aurantiaca]|uniref:non-specific serine/threonine protein kinase n=1 Tax=Stigmatella aurantiaca (strain DW4/3-1) TaxID=378806 RepID=Q08RP6_STIAD|nr:serine/threonine-protein kinase [Stigmatella aurantiaca]ADO72038.1 Protein kinase [Stigmatella aurantiaca DW4/3-1]EAU63148.1 protein kinase [Stigmatella aurantiaca DW4/3-1]